MPLSQRFMTKLRDQLMWSRQQIIPFIHKRMEILRQYVGTHYSHNGARQKVPTNYVRMMASIVERHLVARQPRCMISTPMRELRAIANGFEQYANDRFQAFGLEKVLQRWVKDALVYPIGLVKMGVCSDPDQPLDVAGPRHSYGQVYVDNLDPERTVFDFGATRWDQLDFIGHRYTTAKEWFGQGKGVDQAFLKTISTEPHTLQDERGQEKSEALTLSSTQFERLREYFDVWEIYLPKENLIVTLPVQGRTISDRPIKIEEYEGPTMEEHCGPFYWIGFDEVPGQLMPAPPIHQIYDMHLDANGLQRKLLRQAKGQKTVNLFQQSTNYDDALKVKNAGDGDLIPSTNPAGFTQMRFNGPDQQNLAFNLALKQMISWFGGNFDALGGLAAQSGTLGQDKLLADSSSKLMEHYQQETLSGSRRIMRGVCWYDWHSQKTMQANIPIPGMEGQSVPMQITPQDRRGDFLRMNFQIDPYSMQAATPNQKFNDLVGIVTNLVLPLAPALAPMGVMFNVLEFIKDAARYKNFTDFDKYFVMAQQPMQDQAPQGGQMPAPGNPNKPNGQYTRTSQSNPQSQEMQMMQMLSQPQPQGGNAA